MSVNRLRLTALTAVLVCAWSSGADASETAIGVTSGTAPELVRFDTGSPGTLTARSPLTGLLAGESVAALDMRPASGELWAFTSAGRMLLVDPGSGEARQVGAPLDVALVSPVQLLGIDFNPTVDRLRFVSAAEDNLRVNPLTFLPVDSDGNAANGTQPDTGLAFKALDPNSGQNPSIVASAYSNNDNDASTPATLWGLDSSRDILVRQGAVDGNGADVPGGGSPNGGLLTTIGSLGLDIIDASMDVVRGPNPGGNVAHAALQPANGALSQLSVINLTSGFATLGGPIGDKPLAGLTIALGGAFRIAGPATVTSEAAGQVALTVERAGDTLAAARVGYRTADGTAVAGVDYVSTAGTLEFAAGERSKQVTIALLQNSASEQVESIALELGPTAGGAVVDTRAHVIEIADDDPMPGPSPAPPPADLTRPVFLTAPSSVASLRGLRRAGSLPVDVACSEACVVRLALQIGSSRVGAADASLTAAGVQRLRVRLTAAGRRVIDRARRFSGTASLVLRGTATDSAGNRTSRTVILRVARR